MISITLMLSDLSQRSRSRPVPRRTSTPPVNRTSNFIELRGVSTHNLKGIDVSIPLDGLTVITGVSGSGKSSLAFDTLFAEGQRRYVETFSTYSRQFLPPFQKPAVLQIERIPPAIAVSQHRVTGRVTVASASGLMDHLRAAYARSTDIICPECSVAVRSGHPDRIYDELFASLPGEMVTVRFRPLFDGVATWEQCWTGWREAGFLRIDLGDGIVRTDQPPPPAPAEIDRVRIILDRIKIDPSQRGRFIEAIETAYRSADGHAELVTGDRVDRIDEMPTCSRCALEFPLPDALMFLSTNVESACPTCRGIGELARYDQEKVIPDRTLSLQNNAIAPMATPSQEEERSAFFKRARQAGIDTGRAVDSLPAVQWEMLWHGDEVGFSGIDGYFESLEKQRYKPHVRQLLSRYQSYATCPSCHGRRFRPAILAYRVAGHSIADFLKQTVKEARATTEKEMLKNGNAERWYRDVLADVSSRLVYLDDVGLGYLTLDRSARTLSGGESRRVALGAALGSRLAKTLFVLDEPTAGLHPLDTARLMEAIDSLRRSENTVVVVEHEPAFIRRADWIVDLGPGAGSQGGELLYEGPPTKMPRDLSSPTSLYLRSKIHFDREPRESKGKISLRGASLHSLQAVDVDFPLGILLAVAGVSGSGKSSLLVDTLYAALADREASEPIHPGEYQSIKGYDSIGETILIDDMALGRTSRGNPATYLGFYGAIRDLFASTADAKLRGMGKGDFSFNRPGGRCESCEGLGYLKFDMQFLPESRLTCSACHGRRFESRVRDIKYRGLSIDEVLDLSSAEAFSFFRGEMGVQQRLKVLRDVGLGYLPIGQTLDTLSGGERQRLRLASFVSARPSKRCLFVLEEPTTGLHPADIDPLIDTLRSLVDVGHSVMVIEHNVQFLAAVDHIIELGPGAGPEGGRVIAIGRPGAIASGDTPTGRALAEASR
jgi:excinuclease ABC subunit A